MEKVPSSGQWSTISNILTSNFEQIATDILELQNKMQGGNLGYFETADALVAAYPSPAEGSRAFVGSAAPYKVYFYTADAGWYDTGDTDDGTGGVAQLERLTLRSSTNNTTIVATMTNGDTVSVALPAYGDIQSSGKWGLIRGYDYDSLITLEGLESYVQTLITIAQNYKAASFSNDTLVFG